MPPQVSRDQWLELLAQPKASGIPFVRTEAALGRNMVVVSS